MSLSIYTRLDLVIRVQARRAPGRGALGMGSRAVTDRDFDAARRVTVEHVLQVTSKEKP